MLASFCRHACKGGPTRADRERFLHAPHEQRGEQAGKETAGTDDHGVEGADCIGHDRMNRDLRLEPDLADLVATRLPCVDLDFSARHRSICVLRAH